MEEFTFTLLGEPKPKARPRTVRQGRFVHTYNPKTSAYTSYLTQIAQIAPLVPYSCPLVVHMTFYLIKPKTVKRSYPSVGGDLDNYVKEVSDLCNKRIWVDDSQICRLVLTKLYADKPENARCVISVNEMLD